MELPLIVQAHFFEDYFESMPNGSISIKDTSKTHKINSNITYKIIDDVKIKYDKVLDELNALYSKGEVGNILANLFIKFNQAQYTDRLSWINPMTVDGLQDKDS
jgi:hypothetical protein